MGRLCLCLLACLLAGFLPAIAAGQPPADPAGYPPGATTQPTGGAAPAASNLATTRPGGQPGQPGNGGSLTLNFRDASVRTVLEYLSEAAGLVIFEVAKPEGKITLMSRQPISTDEAVALLDTVLRERGCAAIRNGRTLKIVAIDQAKKELIPVRSGNKAQDIATSDRIITQIIPIRYADAVKLKTDLASLIPSSADVTSNASSNTLIVTGAEGTIRRIVEIIQAIDSTKSEVSQVKVWQLKYASATSAAKLITDIFKEDQTPATANNPFGAARRAFLTGGLGGPGGGGRGGIGALFGGAGAGGTAGGTGAAEESGQRATKVTASSDDRTNTLVVSASPDVLKVIDGVVTELDANPASMQDVFIYRLKNGDATNMQSVLNNVFGTGSGSSVSSTNRTSTGAASTINPLGGGGAFGGSRAGGAGGGGLGSSGMGGMGGSQTFGGAAGAGSARPATGGYSGIGGNRPGSSTTPGVASDLIGQVYVVADADTNSLVITTASKNFERVKAIIMDLDRPIPQVLIKVLLAEVTHNNSLDLGVELSGLSLRPSSSGTILQGPAAGTSNGAITANRGTKGGTDFGVAAQTTGFLFKLDEDNVTAAIHALANVTKLDVLSRPYILTSDNQQAQVMVGQEFPYITNSQITTDGQVINSISYANIGIILQVTPHINSQGLVTLDVFPEISEPTGQTVPLNQFASSPVFAMRFAQTRVAILDGQTIVIGGLMQDQITKTVDKVPFLGDLPGPLGAMFQHTNEVKTKTELLIFLTPHVAQQPEQLKDMSESEKRGLKAIPSAVEPGVFQEHLQGLERGGCPSTQPSVIELDAPAAPAALPPAGKETQNAK